MPSRSSRSRPASFTSWSEPTGSASLAIAIASPHFNGWVTSRTRLRPSAAGSGWPRRRGRRPPRPRRRNGVARPNDVGRLVVPRVRSVSNMAGSSVEIEQRTPAATSRGSGCSCQRRDGAGAEVRERADVEHGAAAGELPDEARILLGADAVAQPVGAERLERAAHGRGARHLARVRDRAEPERLRQHEHLRVRLGRVLRLEPAETDADDAAVAEARRPLHRRPRLVHREAARDVGREADLDAVQLARRVGAVAEALVDLLPVAAAAHPLGRAEDPLEVDGAVRRRLGRVVDDDLAEVLGPLQRVRRQDPDLDEVAEVAEAVELRQPLDRVGRKRVVVPARDLQQRRRADGSFQVHVQLDLRVRRHRNDVSRAVTLSYGSRDTSANRV